VVGLRAVHMVGSMPLDLTSAEDAMRLTLDVAAPHLRSLPDGEPGRNYVTPTIDSLVDHPALEQVTSGDWSALDKRPTYRVRRGHSLAEKPLEDFFLHFTSALDSWPAFQRLRAEYDRPDLSFQVGIPSDFVMAFIALGPRRALRQRSSFADATVRGISRVHELAGTAVVYQLEAPAESLLSAKAPPPFRSLVAGRLARNFASIARRSPPGSRFGLHLCLGSLHDRAEIELTSAAPLVALANATRACWPPGRALEFIHLPLLTDRGRDFFRPLSTLALDAGTRVAAGIVHEDRPLDRQRRTLDWVETAVGAPVDISPVCGLGRRADSAVAVRALDQAVALATS
jgi:hypothetical protein